MDGAYIQKQLFAFHAMHCTKLCAKKITILLNTP